MLGVITFLITLGFFRLKCKQNQELFLMQGSIIPSSMKANGFLIFSGAM
jgi:hypothetical protein